MNVTEGIAALVLGTVALVLLPGCSDDQDPLGAASLWQRIHEENYRSFARAPGYETRKPSDAPHNDQVDIYVNAVVGDALGAGKKLSEWPTGSLIVKDGFTDSGVHAIVAVLDKRQTGWFYAEYFDLESGEARYSGTPAICVGCHTESNDHVNAFGLP